MKKILLLLVILIGSMNLLRSQLYIISPNDTVIDIAPPSTLTIFDIYQRNISGDTISLAWTKISESIPAGWDYSLCDKGTCYPGFPASGSMAIVTPPDSGFLGVNVLPYTFPGTLLVRFYVYETSAPLQGDTLTWMITAQTTGIEDLVSENLIIYPNPSTDYIQINALQADFPVDVNVYDLNGKLLLQKKLMQQSETIDIVSLPSGNYILEIQEKQIIRKSFVKR